MRILTCNEVYEGQEYRAISQFVASFREEEERFAVQVAAMYTTATQGVDNCWPGIYRKVLKLRRSFARVPPLAVHRQPSAFVWAQEGRV